MHGINHEQLITVTEAAEIKGVTKSTVYEWLRKKKIDKVAMSDKWYVVNNQKLQDIDATRGKSSKRTPLDQKLDALEQRIATIEQNQSSAHSSIDARIASIEQKLLAAGL